MEMEQKDANRRLLTLTLLYIKDLGLAKQRLGLL